MSPEDPTPDHRGARLGLPAAGPGSIPGMGLRLLALTLDWAIAYFASRLLTADRYSIEQLAVFFLEIVVFTWLVGGSMAQRFLRMRVVDVATGGRLGLGRIALRTALIMLVFPAAVYDRDQRGLHDRIARSVVVRG